MRICVNDLSVAVAFACFEIQIVARRITLSIKTPAKAVAPKAESEQIAVDRYAQRMIQR